MGTLHFPFPLWRSRYSQTFMWPPPQTFFKSQLKSCSTEQLPYLGILPLNLLLFNPSSCLIPSFSHHDTNLFDLFSLWLVSIASHFKAKGIGFDCQVPCLISRYRQVFVQRNKEQIKTAHGWVVDGDDVGVGVRGGGVQSLTLLQCSLPCRMMHRVQSTWALFMSQKFQFTYF